ncbi:hypothetical protein BMS3Abin02_01834 [bacterium BMS3Abin02]|nr:hypothetical protein BMS3Abin02_01834 [bacterium BMS3Abin02]
MRGSIQHRPDRPAPWRARYRGPDGRQHSRSFDRKIDAERWLRAALAKVDRGEWVDPEHGHISWADYSIQLMAGRIHLAARTIETDRRCHHRATPWIGDVPLSRLTPELLRHMMSELTASAMPPRRSPRRCAGFDSPSTRRYGTGASSRHPLKGCDSPSFAAQTCASSTQPG